MHHMTGHVLHVHGLLLRRWPYDTIYKYVLGLSKLYNSFAQKCMLKSIIHACVNEDM